MKIGSLVRCVKTEFFSDLTIHRAGSVIEVTANNLPYISNSNSYIEIYK
jgi:hypothetical protein